MCGLRLDNRKVLRAPGPRIKYFERLTAVGYRRIYITRDSFRLIFKSRMV